MVNFHEIERINLWLIDFQKLSKRIVFIRVNRSIEPFESTQPLVIWLKPTKQI